MRPVFNFRFLAFVFAVLSAVPGHAGSIRGPVTFGPDARLRLDCPPVPDNTNAVQSEVQGYGHLNRPVAFKLLYRPTLMGSFNPVYGTERYEKDYIQTLNSFLGNFPGPGYYAINMRNTNSYSVMLPANEEIGIICR